MAMCARKKLMKQLRHRRRLFYKEKDRALLEELKTRIDRRMVVAHEQQERQQRWLARAHEANHNMRITT